MRVSLQNRGTRAHDFPRLRLVLLGAHSGRKRRKGIGRVNTSL